MSEHLLSVKKREGTGRGQSRRLRAQGMIPAVIYGKSGNQHFAVAERDFQVLMRKVAGGAAVITLKNEEDSVEALIHEYQRDPLTDRFRHIDFLEVVKGQLISANIPIHIVGEPAKGTKNGGTLEQPVYELQVHCMPKDLPDHINVDVAELDIGESIHLEDLPELEGVHFDDDADIVLASVSAPRLEEPETTAGEESVDVPTAAEIKAKEAEAENGG